MAGITGVGGAGGVVPDLGPAESEPPSSGEGQRPAENDTVAPAGGDSLAARAAWFNTGGGGERAYRTGTSSYPYPVLTGKERDNDAAAMLARGEQPYPEEPWLPTGLPPREITELVEAGDPRMLVLTASKRRNAIKGPIALSVEDLRRVTAPPPVTAERLEKVFRSSVTRENFKKGRWVEEGLGVWSPVYLPPARVEYSLALHALITNTIALEGRTPAAEEALAAVRELFDRNALDWVVTRGEKWEAAEILRALSPPEFFWVAEQIAAARGEGADARKLAAWILEADTKPQGPNAPWVGLLRGKAYELGDHIFGAGRKHRYNLDVESAVWKNWRRLVAPDLID